MSRLFSIEHELNRVDQGLTDTGKEWGTEVRWARFDPNTTVPDDVYDVGSPRSWGPWIEVPVLWALRTEGRNTFRSEGLQTQDSLQFAVAKTVIRDRLGWEGLLTREGAEAFLRDRVEYEGRIFTIDDIQVQGQLEDRDVVVGVVAREVRPSDQWVDEVPNDPVYG